MMFQATQALVRALIQSSYPQGTWTVQGFGMLRRYLDDEKTWRLNIWDDRFRIPNVSDIHDHPWDFESLVVSGQITNERYDLSPLAFSDIFKYQHINIVTGEGTTPLQEPDVRYLEPRGVEIYRAGMSYKQRADEIHRTIPRSGTITLNKRNLKREKHDAHVYWKEGPWINAEPRPATPTEVRDIVAMSLNAWSS